MSEEAYLTAEGAARLRAELEQLKGPARKELAERLRAAVSQGDLSENADYTKAKEDQGFLEGRIQDLERLLHDAVIIEEINGNTDEVCVGAHVTIQEEDYPSEVYHVVGAQEAAPRNGRISNESPIGKALMGHKVGDVVEAQTPGGKIVLKIIKIE
ncbi:MAG: transcription elongation factor GreA [Anaerolineales bacterium]|nr:transcription elongation factor GreA [Anaerolineales bacterium]